MADLSALLNIELPIVQAPMAGVQASALAIAVSSTGGLGSLPAAMLSHEALANELKAITAATDRPYNVNFFCHQAPTRDPACESAWRERFAAYYREFDLDPGTVSSAPTRAPFDAGAADVLAAFRPPVVSFHFGLPNDELLARVRSFHPRILASATTLDEARWLAARGVDAIIAQGVEAGGHRGMFLGDDVATQVGTLPLVRQIARELRVPVIAAGGIADAHAVAAALALGAAGAQIGTAYLLCPEATTSAVHRAALVAEGANQTAVTNVFTGRPARAIVNRLVREIGPMSDRAPPFPLAGGPIAPLRARAESQGSGDFSPMWAGQDTRGCRQVSAAILTRELARI